MGLRNSKQEVASKKTGVLRPFFCKSSPLPAMFMAVPSTGFSVPTTLHKAAGIIIWNRRLLVVRPKGKEHFISPGGKIKDGEDVCRALARELTKELCIYIEIGALAPFGVFTAPAVGRSDVQVRITVLQVYRWKGVPTPSSEIEELRWVSSKTLHGIKLGSVFEHKVMPRLLSREVID